MSDTNGETGRQRHDRGYNGRRNSRTPTVYGTPLQMATLLASVAQLVDVEPCDTWADPLVRRAAREMAGKLHERLAATPGERDQ